MEAERGRGANAVRAETENRAGRGYRGRRLSAGDHLPAVLQRQFPPFSRFFALLRMHPSIHLFLLKRKLSGPLFHALVVVPRRRKLSPLLQEIQVMTSASNCPSKGAKR